MENQLQKFSPQIYSEVGSQTQQTMELTEQELVRIHALLQSRDQKFTHFNSPAPTAIKTHNIYIRTFVRSALLKNFLLNSSIIRSVNSADFLAYGLAGRALIEITAILHNLKSKLKPMFADLPKDCSDTAVMKIVEMEDSLLRGGRFNWQLFLSGQFDDLFAESKKAKESRKKKGTQLDTGPSVVNKYLGVQLRPDATNITTLIEKWAKEEEMVEVVYDLFCDIVHPNYGSLMSISTGSWDGIEFLAPQVQGLRDSTGLVVFNFTFPWLQAIAGKAFNDIISELACLTLPQPDC